LVGKKNLARTSSIPGRTQVVNFFSVDDEWVLVDLPGYGYARVPKEVRERWAPMIEEYLTENSKLRLVVVLVDSRHDPTELDCHMTEWLNGLGILFQVVATKIDKVPKSRRAVGLDRAKKVLRVDTVIPFSAVTGEGSKELWRAIRELI
jgi:GTP-binding protein